MGPTKWPFTWASRHRARAGAVLGGLLLQIGMSTAGILGVLAIPALIGAAAVLSKDTLRRAPPALALSH